MGRICRRHAKSFYFASFFLTPDKRRAVYAVYAFCRMAGEAIRAPGAAESVRPPSTLSGTCCGTSDLDHRMSLFRDRLDEVYANRVELPEPALRDESQHLLHAFARTVQRYQIPREDFVEFAEGCRLDVTTRRYATWGRLERHCQLTGGVLGVIAAGVLGVTSTAAVVPAAALGRAIRLTQILRDVGEDARRGRVYLPLEDLVRFGCPEKELAAGVVSDAFRALMRFEVGRARDLYRAGAEGLCLLGDPGARMAAAVVALGYAGVLDAIERQGYDVFARRAVVSGGRRLLQLPAAWRLARRRGGEALPPVFAVR